VINAKISIAFLLCFSLLCCTANAQKKNKKTIVPITFSGKITAIKDGDTYKVFYNGSEKTIRLEHVDCPEKKQPFGSKAKQFASTLCFGKTVTVKWNGKTDRYKRLIAEVILNSSINVNKELVKNGLAWHFKKYSNNKAYALLEMEARKNKIGIWSMPNPIAPWDWRRRK
jgi:endonuclease YncB( thermonuclease family)